MTDIVIVGGGMVGLTLALRFAEAGNEVTVLEADARLGGLVSPWELDAPGMPGGTLTWDRFYHVTLASDTALRALLHQLGLDATIEWATVRTGVATRGRSFSVSGPAELLRLTPLPFAARLRLGLTVVRAALVRDVDRLEHVPIEKWLRRYSGERAFELFWRPQLRAKLGDGYADASAAFIAVTAQRLLRARRAGLAEERFGVVPGGYERVVDALEKQLCRLGVRLETSVRVERIDATDSGVRVTITGGRTIDAAHAVLTIPSTAISAIVPALDASEHALLKRARYLGVVCVSLVLKEPLTPYYLTYLLDDSLLTGIVDMTNLIPKNRLGGHGLVYLPRYQAPSDPVFDWPDHDIIERFLSDLQRAYPQFQRGSVISARVARVRSVFTMPVVGYLANVAPHNTSIPCISIVNGSQIVHGTLNVDESVALANNASVAILGGPNASTVTTPSDDHQSVASLSLDLDNEWSYLMVRGTPGWDRYPTYLPTVVPRALNEFAAAGLRLTFFVVGIDATHDANKDAIAAIASAGHEIGNHSYRHEPWLHRYSYNDLSRELQLAEDAIRAVTGVQTVGFRGPGYTLSPDVLRVLSERGYRYDASSLPSIIGPIARAFYFRSAEFSPLQRMERGKLFGSFRDGLQPLRPYRWSIPDGGIAIREIPVSTFPMLRIPIHVTYLLYIAKHSQQLALSYFETALRLCDARRIQPSILLHPLDFLGGDDVPSLAFFPSMSMSSRAKTTFVMRVLDRLQRRYDVVTMAEHVDRLGDLGPSRTIRSQQQGTR